MINYRLLNISCPLLREDFKIPEIKGSVTIERYVAKDIFHTELIDLFNSIESPLSIALVFHQMPHHNPQIIHSDGNGRFQCAINWIFCDSYEMCWYKPLKPKEFLDDKVLPGVEYIRYLDEEVEIVETTREPGPILVNIGNVPHKVANLSDKPRVCVSARFDNIDRTWDEAVKRFALWFR